MIRAPALAALVLLSACHTAPVRLPAESAPWPRRKAELQHLDHYVIRGRVAIAAGSEGFNAGLRWVQDGTQAQVSLQGPLGAGGVQVTADGNRLRVRDSHGDELGNEDAREELRARLGFDPPLASLRYWILGVPDPGQPGREILDDNQRLIHLEQGGWQIDYPAYMPANGQSLPARVTLENAGVRVRVLVNSWSD